MSDQFQDDLFAGANASDDAPLAERLRPKTLEEFVGQTHFLNERFKTMVSSDKWSGLVFWGPPGTGKTSLAQLIANASKRPFQKISAVNTGVKEIKETLERSKFERNSGKKAWILFIDEVHRLNKAQQDVLLPFLEEGSIRFIGATTENPSFEINNAILSRSLVFHFKGIEQKDLMTLLSRSIPHGRVLSESLLAKLAQVANGDARKALSLLDHLLLSSTSTVLSEDDLQNLASSQSLYYDKKGEGHYDTISAFIKSVRGSDPDAALYYLARMLESGEDPMFIARRVVILAAEDIGNANPMGLVLAQAAAQSVHMLGMPEARIVLSQAVTYLACSEKSNRAYEAIDKAIEAAKSTGHLNVPMHLRNAPTQAMKEWGYGKGYDYPHRAETGWVQASYLPEGLEGTRFYEPKAIGVEKRFQEFLAAKGKRGDTPSGAGHS